MGECQGFKSFQSDPRGREYAAWLFTSPALPAKYPELDAFEGEGYRRIVIPALVGRRQVLAHIYEGKYCD